MIITKKLNHLGRHVWNVMLGLHGRLDINISYQAGASIQADYEPKARK